jgi:phage shock protein C
MLCGVCKGIAEYFDLSVFWLRVIAVVAGFSTGIVPSLVAYVLAALLMKREPW